MISFTSAVYNESTNEIITGGVGSITVSKFKNKIHSKQYYSFLNNNHRLFTVRETFGLMNFCCEIFSVGAFDMGASSYYNGKFCW